MDLRGQLPLLETESINADFANIDQMSTSELVHLMNREDMKVPNAIAQSLPSIAASVDAITERLSQGGRLVYAGAGTAGRLGVLDAAECAPTFGTKAGEVIGLLAGGEQAMVVSVEGAEDDYESGRNDLCAVGLKSIDAVVGISASGRTPYAVGALQYARSIGAVTIAISCNRNSELCASAEHKIEVIVGPELVAGSTRLKAGTAQKLVLNMLSTLTMIKLGKTYGNLMVNIQPVNQKLKARSFVIVKRETDATDSEVTEALRIFKGDVKSAIVSILTGKQKDDVEDALIKSKGHVRSAIRLLETSSFIHRTKLVTQKENLEH